MPAASAARDPSRYAPRARQDVAVEQEAPVRVLPRPQSRAQAAPRLSLRGAMVFVCVTALMLFIVYAYTQMAEMGDASQDMAKEISQLQIERDSLLKQKNSMIDLKEIERIAVEKLGMVKPTKSQIIYINLSGEDHAEVLDGNAPDVQEDTIPDTGP